MYVVEICTCMLTVSGKERRMRQWMMSGREGKERVMERGGEQVCVCLCLKERGGGGREEGERERGGETEGGRERKTTTYRPCTQH